MAGVFLGRTDLPLADQTLAPSQLEVDRVFASPLLRARQTAELLFPHREITILAGLAERDFGDWEGKRWDEIEAGWPEQTGLAKADWFGTTPPGGEPWSVFFERVQGVWERLPAAGAAAIVAHAGVNAVLWHLASGANFAAFQQDYGEVISLALSD